MDEEFLDLHNTINGEDDFDELSEEDEEKEEGFEEDADADGDGDEESLEPEVE